jgi:pyruvate dehydrogenase E2 component (dihydrolipoamide acetyltransferase)
MDEMSGGCFTITNLGGIGGTHFTPIVNHPEVAIMGMSRSAMEPVWNGESFEPRLMLPLSLSYDHRIIDGADAMRFLRFVAEALEQPFLLAL